MSLINIGQTRKVLKWLGLVLSIYCILLMSCKKETEYYYLNEDEKKFGGFQSGSYWIYQDDSTFQQDSIYCISYNKHFENRIDDGQIVESDEYYDSQLKSTIDSTANLRISIKAYSQTSASYSYVFRFWSLGFGYSSTDNQVHSGRPNDQFVLNRYDQLTVNGNNYQDVTELQATSVTSPYKSVLIAPDFGVIKWFIKSNDSTIVGSWSLIRCKINK